MSEDKRLKPLSTIATEEDWADAVEDECWAKYSWDGLKLLSLPMDIEGEGYEIWEGTRVICDYAFEDRSSLREVVIPASVTSIGVGAFSGCWRLQEAVIPDSVTSIGNDAFSDCSSLREVVIPASVTSIGDGAFNGCKALHVVSRNPLFSAVDDCMLVDNVNHRLISSYNCKKYVAIPASVTSIGNSAFSWCRSLREVVIPASVTSIGNHTFEECRSLRKVVLPASVTNIGNSAFEGCGSLREVVIPASVTDIGECAFSGCGSLQEVVILASVTSIGFLAFYGCPLASIIVPRGRAGRFRELLWNSGCDLSVIREQGGNEEMMKLVDAMA